MNGVKTKKTVFVGLSGGVDSSVAALLLSGYAKSREARKQKGYEVIGVFMRCFNLDGCSERDAEDARRVAEKIGIPFYVWDFEEEYKRRVVDYMVEGYRRGETPNPDVMCNKEIKFGLFLEKALEAGADYVATGHYVSLRPFSGTGVATAPAAVARLHLDAATPQSGDQSHSISDSFPRRGGARLQIEGKNILSRNPAAGELGGFAKMGERSDQQNLAVARTSGAHRWSGRSGLRKEYFSLCAARDSNKDQSYFLWTLTQKQLKRCLFPIGDYLKSEVREIARKTGLPTADKKDSQGICFLGKVTLVDFLVDYLPERRGKILTVGGKKVGEHRGAHFYTIGQRHGIGVGGGTPYYVTEKNIETNTLVVAPSATDESLYRKEIGLTEVNFIRPDSPSLIRANGEIRVLARVRYRQSLILATLYNLTPKTYNLRFDDRVKSAAPGQSAVFYLGDGEMLGGGIIR